MKNDHRTRPLLGATALLALLALAAGVALSRGGVPLPAGAPMHSAHVPPDVAARPAPAAPIGEVSPRQLAGPGAAGPSTGALLVRARHGGAPAAELVLHVRRDFADARAAPRTARTDREGCALFPGLPPGTVLVRAAQREGDLRAEVRAGETVEVDYELPAGWTLRGVVVDDSGAPVGGAAVDLHRGACMVTVATTAPDGTFLVPGCSPALVSARAAGHAPAPLTPPPAGGGPLRLELLDPGGTVAGLVLDPHGSPVADALVHVGPFFDLSAARGMRAPAVATSTDAEGRFAVAGVEPIEQRVLAHSERWAPWHGTCIVVAGAATHVTVRFSPGFTCAGTVRDRSGTPVAGATVVATRTAPGDAGKAAPSGEDTFRATSGADGAFVLHGLPPGTVELAARHAAGRVRASVAGAAGATTDCELVLDPGVPLRGRVLDDEGLPVAGARVHAATGGWTAEGRSDADGRFELAGCPAGERCTVRARAGDAGEEARVHGVDPRAGDVTLVLARDAAPPPGAHLRGTVLGPDGHGLAGAEVRAMRASTGARRPASGHASARTGPSGRFALGPLPPGTWTAVVTGPGLPALRTGPHRLAAGEVLELGPLALAEGGTARVRLEGLQQRGGGIAWVRDTRGGYHRTQWIGERALRTEPLAPGDYRLVLSLHGHAPVIAPFAVRAGDETALTVAMVAGVRQRIVLVRADGGRIGDLTPARWTIARDGEELVHEVAYAEGGAVEGSHCLAPGRYRITARLLAGGDEGPATEAWFEVGTHEAPPLRVELR